MNFIRHINVTAMKRVRALKYCLRFLRMLNKEREIKIKMALFIVVSFSQQMQNVYQCRCWCFRQHRYY